MELPIETDCNILHSINLNKKIGPTKQFKRLCVWNYTAIAMILQLKPISDAGQHVRVYPSQKNPTNKPQQPCGSE